MRIYIESTIRSMLVARPSKDLLLSVRQQITKNWWDNHRHNHSLFVSDVVFAEISRGEAAMAAARRELLENLPILGGSALAEEVAQRLLLSGLIPSDADGDAAHIALAATSGMDILLSWNLKHIANPMIQARLRKLVATYGIELPELRTPEGLSFES
jgi:hypothetical protein